METVQVYIEEGKEINYYANEDTTIGDKVVVSVDGEYVIGTITRLYIEADAEDMIIANVSQLVREETK